MRALAVAVGVVFAVGALNHVARTLHVSPTFADGDGAARHAVFAVVNAAAAIGFIGRWRSVRVAGTFAAAMIALAVQQVGSHGGDALRQWRDEGTPHALDVTVALFVPLAAGLAVAVAVDLGAARRRSGP